MRIANIVNHLHKNPSELFAVLTGSACLLNVDEDELTIIKEVFSMSKEKLFMGVRGNGTND